MPITVTLDNADITSIDLATIREIEWKRDLIGKLCELTDKNCEKEIQWTNDLREKVGLKRI